MRLLLVLTLCLAACDDDEPARGCKGAAIESLGRCLCRQDHHFEGDVCVRSADANVSDAANDGSR